EECTEEEWSLAARLAEHPWRLVVIGEREVDRRIVAEVAHEALLRAWPRLADWLRDERDFLVGKGDTERAQRRWRDVGQVDKALLTGFDLARAEESLTTRSEDLSPEMTAFVQSSVAADRAALVKAQTTQSLFLANLARQQRIAGDAETAALLALEALPDDAAGVARFYVPEPELQLDGALRDLCKPLALEGHAS